MADIESIERTLQTILTEQAGMKEQLKGALRRIDEQKQLTESVHKLATSVELLSREQNSTDKKVDGLQKDIDDMKSRPGKRWDAVTGAAIAAFITASRAGRLNPAERVIKDEKV